MRRSSAGPLDVLSERERSVARLAARGMRSRTIGVTLAISERTVENHLAKGCTPSSVSAAGRS
ncbi:MAG: helix-turn-helix domain-containing protein [Candidatus Dormibacteria bacterium]